MLRSNSYQPAAPVRMDSGGLLPSLDQFMLSPLVTWVSDAGSFDLLPNTMISSNQCVCSLQVKTFAPNDGGMHLDFSELLDGVFLNDIMTQM